jgi:predicted DNA-binding protein with PD1-like motif
MRLGQMVWNGQITAPNLLVVYPSPMRELPIRLRPGADLRRSLENVVRDQCPNGGFVVCGIGSLNNPRLRLAQSETETHYAGPFEMLTLSGTVTKDGVHLHMSIASASGQVFGGHVVNGNEVRTTIELFLVPLTDWKLNREFDSDTGFLELIPKPLGAGISD